VHNAEDLKLTDAGRKVYSGGGIEPDRRFDGPIEGFNPTRFGRTINARNIFDVYAQRFTRKGDTRIAQAPTASARELSPGFEVTDAMVGEFRELVEKSKLKFDEADWQKDLPFIRAMIRYEIDLDLFGVEAARKDLVKSDPQLQFAVTLFPEAQRLLDMTKISGAQRAVKKSQTPTPKPQIPSRIETLDLGLGIWDLGFEIFKHHAPPLGSQPNNIVVSVRPCHNGWALLVCSPLQV
jgi:hypothetical protein